MGKIIALGAGHGLKTAGKRCLKSLDPNQTREWWLNDRIMDKAQKDLTDNYDCTVLRVDDTTGVKDISLSARLKSANNAVAIVFVSMHHNAGVLGKLIGWLKKLTGGTVVFYYSSKAERKEQAERLYNEIVSRTGLVGDRSEKVIKKGFYVIKNTKMPAFLVENGFMDSPTDVPIILSEEHAVKTAQGVVSFLVKEFNLQPKSVAESGAQKPIEVSQTTYEVQKKDTLSKIGERFGVNWREIALANGISSPYTIKVGQKLIIPGGKEENIYYPAYTGSKTTLAKALNSLEIDYSYSYRKQIAKANGITGYMGTASQNTQMYNLLVAGILKKV